MAAISVVADKDCLGVSRRINRNSSELLVPIETFSEAAPLVVEEEVVPAVVAPIEPSALDALVNLCDAAHVRDGGHIKIGTHDD
jgi:hypothetical protein